MEHPRIYAGVDTHSDTHTLALIDEYGRPLATQTFMADPTGYERLAAMIGDPDACLGIGVEGTNSYGAALTRRLVEAGYNVYEVLRPKRAVRRRDGKSDPVDALAAARSVLAGDGTSVPKSADGWVEALRALNAERAQLVTAMTALSNSATGLPATAPEHIRERYRGLRTPIRMRRLAVCRPSGNMVEQGMLVALKAAGKAWKALKEQADLLEKNMRLILEEHARPLLDIYCASTVTAATLAIVAGDNPERIRSEAASDQALRRLPHPCLQRQDQPAPAQQRRQQAGQLRPAPHRHRPHALRKGKMEIIRCLKRFIAREAYRALVSIRRGRTPLNKPPAERGRRLRELRVAHGITQQQIGDALGVHSSRISEIERGTRNLPELERRAALWIQTITTPNQPTQHTETLDNV